MRGNGIGEALMRKAIELCKENDVRLMTLEVRDEQSYGTKLVS